MESYSVQAVLSAKDQDFTDKIKRAKNSLDGLEAKNRSGLGFGILSGIGQKAFDLISRGVGSMVGELESSISSWSTFDNNLEMIGQDAGKAKEKMIDFAEKTIYSASDMAGTYGQLAAVGVKNTGELVTAFGGLASAALNPQQAMQTLSTQATQMAARPKVAWQDFKLMLEQTPAGIAAVAREMGLTTSQLVSDIQEGKVSTDDFFSAIERVGNSDAFQRQATSYHTVGQALDGLKENLINKASPAFSTFNDVAISAIEGVISVMTEGLPSGLDTAIPKVIEKGGEMISNFLTGLLNSLPTVISGGIRMVGALIQGIITNIPNIVSAAGNIILSFVSGLITNFPAILSSAGSAIGEFVKGVIMNFPQILSAGASALWELVKGLLGAIPDAIGSAVDGIAGFFGGIWDAITGKNKEKAPEAVAPVKTSVEEIPQTMESIVPQSDAAMASLFESVNQNSSAAASALDTNFGTMPGVTDSYLSSVQGSVDSHLSAAERAAKEKTTALAGAVDDDFNAALGSTKTYTSGMEETARSGFANMQQASATETEQMAHYVEANTQAMAQGTEITLGSLADSTANLFGQIGSFAVAKIKSMVSSIGGLMGSLVSNMTSAAKNAGRGFLNGLSSMAGSIIGKARSIASSVVGTIKRALRIGSPSRVLEDLGSYTGIGFVNGLDSTISKVTKTSKGLADAASGVSASIGMPRLPHIDRSISKGGDMQLGSVGLSSLDLSLTIGGKSFRAFSDNIEAENGRRANVELAYIG